MAGGDEEFIVEGVAEEALRGGHFRVRVGDHHTVLARPSGRLRQRRIKVVPGDRAQVEISSYDVSRGRITYRFG